MESVQLQLTPEEEAIKRNTDCVYFLASPLTCKKGSECDYRHSESARINPRDCYYWLNGNCMNPKCAFRHPPLDGLFGAQQAPAVPQITTTNKVAALSKAVPCYYFSKGNCLKGDRCPFMHGPVSSVSNPPTKVTPSQKKDPSEQPIIPQKISPNSKFIPNNKVINNKLVSNFAKPASNLNKPTSLTKAETTMNNNNNNNAHQLINKSMLVNNNYRSNDDNDNNNNNNNNNNNINNLSDDEHQEYPNSPGFDVLVDHDEDDSRFLHHNEEDHHHHRRAYEGYELTAEMYPLDHDYKILPRYEFERERERERYSVLPEQDYQPEFDPYERKRRRENSGEREPSRRRSHHRDEIDQSNVDGSDLRFRLMNKQKREDRSHRQRRDERRRSHDRVDHVDCINRVDNVDRIGRGTRLQGRITIPERRLDLMHLETERDWRRNFRVSPPVRRNEIMRPRSSEFVGRPGFRRSEEDFANFAGPKSLRELKRCDKVGGEERGIRERERDRDRETESSLDFEGPKPLSVILKRKREAAGNNGSGSSPDDKIDNHGVPFPKEEQVREDEDEEEGMIPEGDNTTDIKESEVSGIDDKQVEEPYDPNYNEMEEGEEYLEEGEDVNEEYIQEGEEVNEEYIEEGEEVNEEYIEEVEEVNEEYQEGEGEQGNEEYQEGGEEEYEEDEDDFARKVGVVIA